MIPLRHNIPRLSFPVVVLALIAINTVVFLYQFSLNDYNQNYFVMQNGVVPAHVTQFLAGRVPLDAASRPFLHLDVSARRMAASDR